MTGALLMAAAEVHRFEGVILDCRFDLANPAAGKAQYGAGHVPGALHLDLETDLSAPRGEHGGRHPLPATAEFAATMAARGVGLSTPVLLYDDGSMVFAARAWWMLRALGYGPLRLLAGGLGAWEAAGGTPVATPGEPEAVPVPSVPAEWPLACDREQLAALQEQGAALVDCRDSARYRGEHEPIDPVAGHIPGASNLPWMTLTDPERGLRDAGALRAAWGETLERDRVVVYCGSGVSACVNLLSLAVLGRDDAWLYGGSWSDWCSFLE